MTPLVPDVNLYSGSARLAGNPWNPGALVKRIIQMGTDTEEAASALWSLLFGALSVDSEDDAWARWLQEEFSRRKLATINMTWQQVPWKQDSTDIATSDKSSLRFSNGDKDWVESARSMFIESIASADAADEADGLRLASWNTISRVWSLKNSEDHHARSLALALGYPPPTDNVLSFGSQSKALRKLAEQLEDGFTLAIDQFKEEAESDDEKAALDTVLSQLLARCPTSTAVTQSMCVADRLPAASSAT